MAFTSASDGFAVTRGGVIARSRDGGSTWTQIYQLTGGRFGRVEAVDGQTVYAVAETGCDPGPNCAGPAVLLRTTDGGQNWNQVQPELPASLMPTSSIKPSQIFPYLSFQFLSAQVGYAGGDRNQNALLRSVPLMVTRDGGQSWTAVQLPDGRTYANGFSFVTPDRGCLWVSGTYFPAGYTSQPVLLHSVDGGQNWAAARAPGFGIGRVQFVGAQDGWAIGGGEGGSGLLVTRDGGRTWTEVWPQLTVR